MNFPPRLTFVTTVSYVSRVFLSPPFILLLGIVVPYSIKAFQSQNDVTVKIDREVELRQNGEIFFFEV